MNKKYHIVLMAGCFLAIAGISYSCTYKNKETKPVITTLEENKEKLLDKNDTDTGAFEESSPSITPEITAKTSKIYVHLCGSVAKPDVYEVEAGARLVEIIQMAGGLTANAAGDYMNQAMVVEDGQRIYIPSVEEVAELSLVDYIDGSQDLEQEQKMDTNLVNINIADAGELMELPGIGQAKAESIIEYRDSKGKFKTIEELKNIPGIKEGLFGQISSYITVN